MANSAGNQNREILSGQPAKGSVPKLLLSSTARGWQGLTVEAFDEPPELFDFLVPDRPDTNLVLMTTGTIQAEQRPSNGRWRGMLLRQNEITLTPGGGNGASELRWRSLLPGPLTTLHLQLSQPLIEKIAAEELDLNPAQIRLSRKTGFRDPLVSQVGLALLDELKNPSPTGKLYAETAGRLLIAHLLGRYNEQLLPRRKFDPAESSPGLTRQQLDRVIEFSAYHMDEDLSLETLAAQTGFSPYHFAHLFRQTTGESPHQFVLRQRIEKARRLLTESNLPLAAVALETGFANQSHFSRIFKRFYGLTPHQFRRQG